MALCWMVGYAHKGQIQKEVFSNISGFAKSGERVEAVILGDEKVDLTTLFSYGAKKVYSVVHPDFKHHNLKGVVRILGDIALENKPDLLVFIADNDGKEIAPALSYRLGCGYIPDIKEIKKTDNGGLNFIRPLYAGKIEGETEFIHEGTNIISVRPGSFTAEKIPDNTEGEIEEIAWQGLPDPKIIVKEVHKSQGKIDVAEADIIVAGGRGVKSAEHFKLLEEVAKELGAAVGASRAVVDEGWREQQDQIGQTGKTVSPHLYIACGISGAVQHAVGMNRSRCIIAINKNPDAPIMKFADYAVVGDLLEILPLLKEKLKKS